MKKITYLSSLIVLLLLASIPTVNDSEEELPDPVDNQPSLSNKDQFKL